MPLSPEDIRAIVAAFDDSDWDELSVTVDGTRLTLGRQGPPAEQSRAEAPPPAAAAVPTTTPPAAPAASLPAAAPVGASITSPSVGLFWRSPQPGAPPFVEVGDRVEPEDTVCIIEVMKLMNHVRAGQAGTVRAVHPTNGQMVEHGEALFTIEPRD